MADAAKDEPTVEDLRLAIRRIAYFSLTERGVFFSHIEGTDLCDEDCLGHRVAEFCFRDEAVTEVDWIFRKHLPKVGVT